MESNNEIILHIGAGKCGSSALQRAMSLSPRMSDGDGRRYRYTFYDRSGNLAGPDRVYLQALSSPWDYAACTGLETPQFNDETLDRLSKSFSSALEAGYTPILSNEHWLVGFQDFVDREILLRWGVRARVVMYVRPPVDWLNSGWWQWGVWENQSPQHWMSQNLYKVEWDQLFEHWSKVPGVSRVDLRLGTSDVVQDFAELLSVELPNSGGLNKSLGADILRLMQRNRELRPGPHNSAIDFTVSRWLEESGPPQPWVVSAEQVRAYLSDLRPGITRLLNLVQPEIAERIRSDARWWDPHAYHDRLSEGTVATPTIASADRAAVALAKALVRSDAEVRKLRVELMRSRIQGG